MSTPPKQSLSRGSTVLFSSYDTARSPFRQGFGLMFHFSVKKPLVFFFPYSRRISLHMFCVFTAIDVLYLDKSLRVVEIIEHFRPFTYYMPREKASYVIELPRGSIAQYSLKKGDILSLNE